MQPTNRPQPMPFSKNDLDVLYFPAFALDFIIKGIWCPCIFLSLHSIPIASWTWFLQLHDICHPPWWSMICLFWFVISLIHHLFAPSFPAEDCFQLGRYAYNAKDYYHTYIWMQAALQKEKGEENKTVSRFELLDYSAYAIAMVRHHPCPS